MKKFIISFALCAMALIGSAQSNHQQKNTSMKVNAGIVTEKIQESKLFYTTILEFEVVFENDFYLLLRAPSEDVTISFLLPNHESQQPIFQSAFAGEGMFLTIELEDVDAWYEKVKSRGCDIALEIRDEPWGDRHFAIVDPSGIGIDMVTYTAPE